MWKVKCQKPHEPKKLYCILDISVLYIFLLYRMFLFFYKNLKHVNVQYQIKPNEVENFYYIFGIYDKASSDVSVGAHAYKFNSSSLKNKIFVTFKTFLS